MHAVKAHTNLHKWQNAQSIEPSLLYEKVEIYTKAQAFANNKDSDQSAHPPSLISAFVIQLLESTISKLATNEI